jgi:hypothetical protein
MTGVQLTSWRKNDLFPTPQREDAAYRRAKG